MKKTLLSLAMTAMVGIAGIANAGVVYQPFTVSDSFASGFASPNQTGDRFIGGYDELFIPTGGNGFSTVAVWNANGLKLGSVGGNVGILGLDETIAGGLGYGMYAVFTSTGTFSQSGTVTNFTGNTGSISVYLDRNQNTTHTYDTFGNPVFLGFGEDLLLGSTSTLVSAVGQVDSASAAAGNFDFVFSPLALTSNGTSYFVAGSALTLSLGIEGNVNDFDPTRTAFIEGSATAGFGQVVPEPGSLALLGLGLVGLAASRRRKSV